MYEWSLQAWTAILPEIIENSPYDYANTEIINFSSGDYLFLFWEWVKQRNVQHRSFCFQIAKFIKLITSLFLLIKHNSAETFLNDLKYSGIRIPAPFLQLCLITTHAIRVQLYGIELLIN
jgi:hypothetical protein